MSGQSTGRLVWTVDDPKKQGIVFRSVSGRKFRSHSSPHNKYRRFVKKDPRSTTDSGSDLDYEEDSKKWRFAQKLGVFLICLGFLLYLSFLSIQKYSYRETATADKYEHATRLSFPTITLCPSVPYDR